MSCDNEVANESVVGGKKYNIAIVADNGATTASHISSSFWSRFFPFSEISFIGFFSR